ncbi:MAG: hypothetical protein JNN08_14795 [Bryobacterales bacterium]|nr:hypothetical protein [Bryobacterales bacterium]
MSEFPILRRQFLRQCAGCAAAAVCGAAARIPDSAPACSKNELWPTAKARVRVVFSQPERDREGWPYVNYDYATRQRQVMERFRRAIPTIDFIPSTVASAREGSELFNDASADGFVVYLLGIPSGGIARRLIDAGKPVVLVDDLYGGTGEFLTTYSRAVAEKKPVAGVSSSNFDDVTQIVRCYEAIRKLKASTILDVCERVNRGDVPAIPQAFGTRVKTVGAAEINDAYRKASDSEATRWADQWLKEAEKTVEPSRDELVRSARMYLAMAEMLKDSRAQAMDVDCLHLFYGKKLPAYPCIGFREFNDAGLVGACEADLQSTITMLAMTYLAGRPGFISDPVIDTSKNQIIYAHCVAPTRPYGPSSPVVRFHLRDHSEDRKGAVVQAFLPIGETTTTLKILPQTREMVFHQAKAVDNLEDDRACRTKLAAQPADARALLTGWHRWGWHRVTYYGDLRAPVEAFAALTGLNFVTEGAPS